MSAPAESAQPLLRVVNPDATPEEVAAIVAVFAALGAAAPAPAATRSLWTVPVLRGQSMHVLHPGQDAWRASAYRL